MIHFLLSPVLIPTIYRHATANRSWCYLPSVMGTWQPSWRGWTVEHVERVWGGMPAMGGKSTPSQRSLEDVPLGASARNFSWPSWSLRSSALFHIQFSCCLSSLLGSLLLWDVLHPQSPHIRMESFLYPSITEVSQPGKWDAQVG